MKRLIWLPLAGFLLIAGAAVAAAAPTITAVSGSALSALTDTGADAEERSGSFHGGFGGVDLLEQVLADLVEAGTITRDQSDAITQGLADKVEARRTAAQAQMELMQGFIEDGVITQEEINQLPDDSPLREVFSSIAEDGQVSIDQLRELGPGLGRGRGHGPGFGPGPDWNGEAPDTDDETDTTN